MFCRNCGKPFPAGATECSDCPKTSAPKKSNDWFETLQEKVASVAAVVMLAVIFGIKYWYVFQNWFGPVTLPTTAAPPHVENRVVAKADAVPDVKGIMRREIFVPAWESERVEEFSGDAALRAFEPKLKQAMVDQFKQDISTLETRLIDLTSPALTPAEWSEWRLGKHFAADGKRYLELNTKLNEFLKAHEFDIDTTLNGYAFEVGTKARKKLEASP